MELTWLSNKTCTTQIIAPRKNIHKWRIKWSIQWFKSSHLVFNAVLYRAKFTGEIHVYFKVQISLK